MSKKDEHHGREGVVPEKSIVLSWAVLEWSVQSDLCSPTYMEDVSVSGFDQFPASINSALDSRPAVPTGV